jgi:hypothetical protein
MRLAGFLLMPAGWFIALAALVLLRPGHSREVFALAGVGVELLGLFIVIHSHAILHRNER